MTPKTAKQSVSCLTFWSFLKQDSPRFMTFHPYWILSLFLNLVTILTTLRLFFYWVFPAWNAILHIFKWFGPSDHSGLAQIYTQDLVDLKKGGLNQWNKWTKHHLFKDMLPAYLKYTHLNTHLRHSLALPCISFLIELIPLWGYLFSGYLLSAYATRMKCHDSRDLTCLTLHWVSSAWNSAQLRVRSRWQIFC